MIVRRVAPMQTRMLVLRPAGLCRFSRSNPIIPPRSKAKVNLSRSSKGEIMSFVFWKGLNKYF